MGFVMFRFLKSVSILALIFTVTAPSASYAWRAFNSLRVNPEGQDTFEVIQSGGISAADAWCAAGDFAIRRLGANSNQRIYLIEGKHIARTEERRRFGYSFSLTPPPEAQNFTRSPLTLSLRNVGDSLTAINARQYCYDRLGNGDKWRL